METLKIVKIGGNIIDDATALATFLADFSKLSQPKILVHGGGKSATKLANQMDVPVKMLDGRRVTDAKTLEIITMVYAGKINKTIVAKLQEHECNSIGFSGADGNTIVSVKRPIKEVDYGFVGDVKKVHTRVLDLLLKGNITPVFCAITHDENGQLLNTNADTIAAELAIAFAKEYQTELYYCFEKNGVLQDVNDADSVIEKIDTASYKTLVTSGVIADGMLPKLNNCFYAIDKEVYKVCIGKPEMMIDSTIKHTTITH